MLDGKVPIDFRKDTIPSIKTFISQIAFNLLCEDFVFHTMHKLLHRPWFYQRIHKVHHHYTNTVFYATVSTHPIEYIFGNALPTMTGPLILGRHCHVTTFLAWVWFRSDKSYTEHSGYDFSFSMHRCAPLTIEYGYHVYHHSHNVGNYSNFFHTWDTVFGCNHAYYAHLEDWNKGKVKAS